MNSLPHRDSAALVIGGTQGLGLAIARQLQAEGCSRLVIAARDAAKGGAVAETLGVPFMQVDLADNDQVRALVNAAHTAFGRLDVLINAAARSDRGSVLDTTPALFDQLFATNTRGPFFALQRFAQLARAGGYPAQAVNILSMVVHCGQSFLAPYSASKAALANITKNAANALRSDRIRVNAINCGWMDTPGEDAIQRAVHGAQDGWLEQAEAAQPFGSLVKPADVARLAAFMAGPASGVMTGAIVDFDQNIAGAYPE